MLSNTLVKNPKQFPIGHVFNREDIAAAIEDYLDLKPLSAGYRKKMQARLNKLLKPYIRLLDQIVKNGEPYLIGKALNSHGGRVMALVRAFAKRENYRALSEIEKMAWKVDCYELTTESVAVRWIIPDGDKPRIICMHGVIRTAKALMLRDVLYALGVDGEHDYSRRGAGGEKAIIRAISKKMAEGYDYWVTPDVTNCFPSMRPGHFKELPISDGLISNVAFLNKETPVTVLLSSLTIGEVHSSLLTTYGEQASSFPSDDLVVSMSRTIVRQGLCLGSVLSPLLVRWFLSRAIQEAGIGEYAFVGSYVDDLAIGCVTKAEAAEALSSLTGALAHPAGDVLLHDTTIRYKKNKYFLGYALQPGRGYGNNPVHVKPGPKRIKRFKARLKWKLIKAKKSGKDLLSVGEDYGEMWYASQHAWTKVPGHSHQLSLNITSSYVQDFKDGYPMGANKGPVLGG